MMNKENFTYWLNGFLELTNPDTVTEQQICIIKEHMVLALSDPIKGNINNMEVFVHWLDGFLAETKELDVRLTNVLMNKISDCFVKVTGLSQYEFFGMHDTTGKKLC